MRQRLFSVLAFAMLAACNTDEPPAAEPAGPCANGIRDGAELGVDCGPACNRLCDGAECVDDGACGSGKCSTGKCAASAGKTCGVGLPNKCADAQTCGVDDDCTSDYCDATCKAPPADAAHADGRRNAGETGKDCGGTAKDKPCPSGEKCVTEADCQSTCNANLTCDPPNATDGKKNGAETDTDCGGGAAPPCAVDKACLANADCALDACTDNKCVVPTDTDATKNGSETDVDCGGPGVTDYKAPRCTVGKACTAPTDCLTGACSPGGKCAVQSCATAETAGIDSCGEKETGEAGAVHESCCKSLVMPTLKTKRLDKYEITAGRFRSFLTKAGPDLREWVKKYAAANPTSQLAKTVTTYPVFLDLYPAADRFDHMSLTAQLSVDIDNYDGNRGCFNDAGSYSANTYWQDADHLSDWGLPPRSLARSISDEKPMNCAMPIMFQAFCAWDGGELATLADYADVWPATQTFPFGNTNLCTEGGGVGEPGKYKPCAAYNWCNGGYENGGFLCQNLGLAVNGEPGVFYEFPVGGDRSLDNEPLIAAPGRFPLDETLVKSAGEGWRDLFGNLAEYTGDLTPGGQPEQPEMLRTFCDMSGDPIPGKPTCTRALRAGQTGTLYTGIPQTGVVGSTWEGHQYGRGGLNTGLPATFQYGKFGGRCVRPAKSY